MFSFLFMGVFVIMGSFVLSLGRFLNCLIVLENFNVLLLIYSILLWGETHMIFISLIVIFTVEVTLSLVVLTRLWDLSCLVDIVSF